MSSQPFDVRNAADYDRITAALTEALALISRDGSIKATASELSRISGVHRNTIYLRQFPLDKLALIKEQRALKKVALARKKVKRQDPVSILEDRLEKSRLEVVYWFNMYRDSQETAGVLNTRLVKVRDARDLANQDCQDHLSKIGSLETEIERLRDIIAVLEAENAEKAN